MTIKATDIHYAYKGGSEVLKGLSFEIPEASFVCLLGPNGVGKSTLFRCMLGLLPGYQGEIEINGSNIRNMTPRQLARKVAYIPQSTSPVFHYSVRDMVLMGTTSMISNLGAPGKEEDAYVEKALSILQIQHLQDRMFTRISGGERQLVLIARALAQQANILFMDEPTANLDYGNQLRVLQQVKDLTRQGYTVVQSTHNPEQAFLYADRVLAVKDGKLLAEGSPGEVMDSVLMKELYGVDVCVERLYDGKVSICIPKFAL